MGFLSEIPNFLAIFIPNVLLLVGFVLDSNENSIWLKNSIYFFAAFLFSAVTRKILPKISVFASNSSKETNIDLSFRQIIFPKKSRNLFRLIFTTFFTILHVILFEKSKGNSKLGNGIILIFIRFFCSISSNVFSVPHSRLAITYIGSDVGRKILCNWQLILPFKPTRRNASISS